MSEQQEPGSDRARREPLFDEEQQKRMKHDEFVDRDTLGDASSSNRGMDDTHPVPKDKDKRAQDYVQSKNSNIDQDIDQNAD